MCFFLGDAMLSVYILIVIMLSVSILRVFMLSAVLLRVIMLCRGARYLTGENLEVVWAEFSALS